MSGRKRARKERRRVGRTVQRELKKAGVKARLARVRDAVKDTRFTALLLDEIAWAEVVPSIRNTDEIRDLALKVLQDMGVDTDGINFTVVWKPNDGRQLEFRACLMPGVAEAAIAAAKERETPEAPP